MADGDRETMVPAFETLIGELLKTVRGSSMYPPGHPSLMKSFENTFKDFQDFMGRAGEFSITVGKEGLNFDEIPLDRGNDVIKKFSQGLNLKSIYRLTFKESLTFDEFQSFMQLLSMESKDFREQGGANDLFARNNIKSISVKQADYDNLLKGGAAEDGEGEEPKDETPLPVEMEKPQEDEEEKEIEAQTERYLSALSDETDPLKFKKIIIALTKFVGAIREEGRTELILKIITAITGEALPGKKRPRETQLLCIKAVRRCADDEVIKTALDKYTKSDEKSRVGIANVIKAIGSDCITPALDRLIVSEGSSARRSLITLIEGFKEAARPKVEIQLLDDRWYVVRNMAMILGEIGSDKSQNPLSRIINHEDIRVQREVVKALTKIGGKGVPEFFLKILNEGTSPNFTLIIINSLGVFRDPVVIDYLLDIINKRDFFHRNHDMKKEAINSLARLKSEEAIEPLGRLLLKGEFFSSIRSEDLKIYAAKALGRIGGDRSAELLFKSAKKRNRNIRKASEASLHSLGFGYEEIRR